MTRFSRQPPEMQTINPMWAGSVTGRWTSIECNFEEIEKRILTFYEFPQHVHMAAELFDVPLEDVTEEQRRYAKTFNLMKLYSATPLPEVIKKGYQIPH